MSIIFLDLDYRNLGNEIHYCFDKLKLPINYT